jgi:hypothetical protein
MRPTLDRPRGGQGRQADRGGPFDTDLQPPHLLETGPRLGRWRMRGPEGRSLDRSPAAARPPRAWTV